MNTTGIPIEALEVGMIVRITDNAPGTVQGLVGHIFKVLAIDGYYSVLEWLEGGIRTKHSVDLREIGLAAPSDEYIAALTPDESWPTEIG